MSSILSNQGTILTKTITKAMTEAMTIDEHRHQLNWCLVLALASEDTAHHLSLPERHDLIAAIKRIDRLLSDLSESTTDRPNHGPDFDQDNTHGSLDI